MVKSTVNGNRREALFKGTMVIANLEDCMAGADVQGDDNTRGFFAPQSILSATLLWCLSPVVGAVVSFPCGRTLSTPHRAPYYLLYSSLGLPFHLPLPVALTGLLSVSLSTVPSSRPRERDSQSMESRTRIAQAHRVLLHKTVEKAVHHPPPPTHTCFIRKGLPSQRRTQRIKPNCSLTSGQPSLARKQ